MKASSFVGSAAALLLAGFRTAQGAPVDAPDFSADLRNFGQIQQLMHNLRSRIGIPFSAMRNVGLDFNQTLDVNPLDLVLLPSGYCFSCSTPPHTEPNQSKAINPFHNEMVELDESRLLVACTDGTERGKPDEWPLMKACPGQEKTLREFLFDVCGHGSRLAIPKARLENAPIFQVDKRTYMPKHPKHTTCLTASSTTTALSTILSSSYRPPNGQFHASSKLDDQLQILASNIYQQKTLPFKRKPSISQRTGAPASTKASAAVSCLILARPEATSTLISSFQPSPKPTAFTTLTSFERRTPLTGPEPAALNAERNYWRAMHSFKQSEAAASSAAALASIKEEKGIASSFPSSSKPTDLPTSTSTSARINAAPTNTPDTTSLRDWQGRAHAIPPYVSSAAAADRASASSARAAALRSTKDGQLAVSISIQQGSIKVSSSAAIPSAISTTTRAEVTLNSRGFLGDSWPAFRYASKSTKTPVAMIQARETIQSLASTASSVSTEDDTIAFSTSTLRQSVSQQGSPVSASDALITAMPEMISDHPRPRGLGLGHDLVWHHYHNHEPHPIIRPPAKTDPATMPDRKISSIDYEAVKSSMAAILSDLSTIHSGTRTETPVSTLNAAVAQNICDKCLAVGAYCVAKRLRPLITPTTSKTREGELLGASTRQLESSIFTAASRPSSEDVLSSICAGLDMTKISMMAHQHASALAADQNYLHLRDLGHHLLWHH